MVNVPDAFRRLVRGKGSSSQALFNTLGLVVLYSVNFFTLPLFSRMLGAPGFGTVSLFTSWAQIGTVVIGLQVSATLPMAAVDRNSRALERYAAAVLSLTTITTLIVLPAVIVWDAAIARLIGLPGIPTVMLLAQAYFGGVVGLASQLFVNQLRAVMNFVLSTSLSLAGVVLSYVLMLGPMRDRTDLGRITGVFAAYAMVGAGLVVFLHIRGRVVVDREAWAFCLPISVPLILHGLSAVVLAQIGKVMLQQLTGRADLVGFYSMAVTAASLLQALLYALNNTWVPFFYRMLSPSAGAGTSLPDAAPDPELEARASSYVLLFTALACGLVLVAPEVVHTFAGPGFEPAVGIMPFMVGAVFVTFLYLLPVNYQLYRRNSRYVSVGTVLAATLAVVLSYPLIRLWGLYGAGLANLLAYLMLFGFHAMICRLRMPEYPFTWRLFAGPICAYTTAAATMVVALPWWPVRWVLAAGVGAVLIVRVVKARRIF